MKCNDFKKYVLISTVPILILVIMCISPLITYIYGKEIAIKANIMDPRDVFRGDYIYLDYPISQINIDMVSNLKNTNLEKYEYKFQNKKVYVVLAKKGNYYEVNSLQFEKPKNKLYLNGKIQYFIRNYNEKSNNKITGVKVAYNLDKYFITENSGNLFDKKNKSGDLSATIKVYKGYSLLINIK